MKQLLALSLCLSGPALAHPGHGVPGIHAHLADAALVLLGMFFVFGLFVLVGKALKA